MLNLILRECVFLDESIYLVRISYLRLPLFDGFAFVEENVDESIFIMIGARFIENHQQN